MSKLDDKYSFFIHGLGVSGGERAEYRLLKKLDTAGHKDMLLIDEPEASFDNIFIRDEVNNYIKKLSEVMPVFVVTHNHTVGFSINPDYIVYNLREIVDDEPKFRVYHGKPSDLTLEGKYDEVEVYEVSMNSLEAGEKSYKEKGVEYEKLIKNR